MAKGTIVSGQPKIKREKNMFYFVDGDGNVRKTKRCTTGRKSGTGGKKRGGKK